MADPLRDPRFPNRPQTPDFWRLSETAMHLDGRTREGGEPALGVVDDYVDHESLLYFAENRVNLLLDGIGLLVPLEVRAAMVSTYLGGVVHGIVFEKAGGHRE